MRKIRLIFWSVLILMFLAAAGVDKLNIGRDSVIQVFFLMVVWWFTGMFISRWVLVMFMRSLHCKNCGLEIPAVGQWQIGSFHDHRHRHILAAKSPIDGARVGHINCPQCECTILV